MVIPKVIRDWLAEYKVLSKEEIHSYAASVRHNGELITSLHSLFDEHPDGQVLDPVCNQLFEFYRSNEKELQRFSLELVPPLIWLYLSFVSKGDKANCGGVEAFLLSIYNLETCTADGTPKVKTFRIPSFSKHSIYHEPQILSSGPLSESTLSRFNAEHEEYRDGPYPQYESINGQNRHGIVAYLLQCYHGNISNLSSRSHKMFCKMCSRIVSTGFNNTLIQQDDDADDDIIRTASLSEAASAQRINQSGELNPRISVSPALLIDMLSCLYYIMFNGQAGPGAQAIVDIHYRACYELFSDVLLVTNAIRNSLRENPSGQPDDGPIGLSLALSPASSSYALSKTAITNASFRAKKLPDDIPVQPDEPKLPTIEEDDSSSKSKGWKGKLIKKDKGDKSRAKENRNSDLNKSNLSNGDTSTDNVQVSVTRAGQQRTVVDSIEMSAFSKSKEGDVGHVNSSPYSGKHISATVKSSSAIKTSISNKDIKNTKLAGGAGGHTRNLSGGSAGSECFSTDL